MKAKKTIAAVAVCAVLAVSAAGLAACSDTPAEYTPQLLHLAVPTNVTVHYGDDNTTSEDDWVTFDAVENAVSYQLYVYQTGDTTAKVVVGETTSIEMPSDLTEGTYNVSVRAIGDLETYDASNGSDPVTYTLSATKLATVSNIKVDITDVNAVVTDEETGETTYPTISFNGVDNAISYTVRFYTADSKYNKTASDAFTTFNIPASEADASGNISYMIPEINYEDFNPGYYVIEVTAKGDGNNYTDSDTATGTSYLGNATYPGTPNVHMSDNCATIDNVSTFVPGMVFHIEAYSDEECTELVAEKDISFVTYNDDAPPYSAVYDYTEEMTGYNNEFDSIDAEDVTDDTDTTGLLVNGTTYYFRAILYKDGTIYVSDSGYGDVLEYTAGETVASSSGGGMGGDMGGFPGGDMGGMGGDMPGDMGGNSDDSSSSTDTGWVPSLSETYTIDTTEDTADFVIGTNSLFAATYVAADDEAAEDCSYSYTFGTTDQSAPFSYDESYLYLKEDGTVTMYIEKLLPMDSDYTYTGTWTVDGTTITITFNS